ncbi:uncharacterized protein LOC131066852 isoform X2 [Cryptomeria japonica]|uniref:uncharacterized protein LOC131066852 isoform X2 n=1 Tax=Cryptomeria japonica TaxID=3369 RepID=UPI0027DAB1EE|nr:uncharacterized protein LOC131066852 isoform X2 [Cryptomeria japonica]
MAKKPAYCNNKEQDSPAVRVYTVCDESRYRLLDEEECEPFTDVILIKFIYIGNARFAKRKLDEHSFFGNLLHVTYAPEYETLLDTKDKLEERRHTVRSRLNPSKQRGTIPQAVSSPVEPDALPEPSSLPGTVWKYPKFPLEQVAMKAEETDYSASGISQCQDKASAGSMLTAQYFSSSSMNATVQSVRDNLDRISNVSLPSQSRDIEQSLGKRQIHGSPETNSSLKKTRHDNRRRI